MFVGVLCNFDTESEKYMYIYDYNVSLCLWILGLNIFIHVNENKHINKQYITMVYDGIQKEVDSWMTYYVQHCLVKIIFSECILKI